MLMGRVHFLGTVRINTQQQNSRAADASAPNI